MTRVCAAEGCHVAAEEEAACLATADTKRPVVV